MYKKSHYSPILVPKYSTIKKINNPSDTALIFSWSFWISIRLLFSWAASDRTSLTFGLFEMVLALEANYKEKQDLISIFLILVSAKEVENELKSK